MAVCVPKRWINSRKSCWYNNTKPLSDLVSAIIEIGVGRESRGWCALEGVRWLGVGGGGL